MNDMCHALHRLFKSARSGDVFDDCKGELIVVRVDTWPARYLLSLLFSPDRRNNAMSGLQSEDKSSESKMSRGTSDEHKWSGHVTRGVGPMGGWNVEYRDLIALAQTVMW